MKIIYNEQDYSQEAITRKCMERLIYEENSFADITDWINQGVSYEPLTDFDYSGNCSATKQLLKEDKVAYIITELDSPEDNFVYVGLTD